MADYYPLEHMLEVYHFFDTIISSIVKLLIFSNFSIQLKVASCSLNPFFSVWHTGYFLCEQKEEKH